MEDDGRICEFAGAAQADWGTQVHSVMGLDSKQPQSKMATEDSKMVLKIAEVTVRRGPRKTSR